MEYKYFTYSNVLIFIPILLFFIIYNLKIRRFTVEQRKKTIDRFFIGLISIAVVLFLIISPRSSLWNSKSIFYFDTFLLTTVMVITVFVMAKQTIKDITFLKNILLEVFTKKLNILELVVMLVLLSGMLIYDNVVLWGITLILFLILFIKEILLLGIAVIEKT